MDNQVIQKLVRELEDLKKRLDRKLSFDVPVGAENGWIKYPRPIYFDSTNVCYDPGSDRTVYFPKGTKIKAVVGGVTKFFYVISTAYNGNTLINVTGGIDFILDGPITDFYYSYHDTPQGFPGRFSFYPSALGLTNPNYHFRWGVFRMVEGMAEAWAQIGIYGWSDQTGYMKFTLPTSISGETNLFSIAQYRRAGGSANAGIHLAYPETGGWVVLSNTAMDDAIPWEGSAYIVVYYHVYYRT